ncbi:YciI family protein [Bosea sp. (in: a-proteobacteria)]|uniref:YciI family protein n=1 Tax=Bosea sp. (in: a-proteobacteria) TaxID=1871050 RepID=UPI003B3B7A1B
MFIVILRFSANKARAPQLMQAHNEWIQRGFADGVFLLTGSLESGSGGLVLATATGRDALEARLEEDPFVAQDVVKAEIIGITPGRADERLAFLLG